MKDLFLYGDVKNGLEPCETEKNPEGYCNNPGEEDAEVN